MLCLSRRIGERIVIGKDIIVTVNKIAGSRVTLGIEAPADVPIHREKPDAIERNKVEVKS